MRIKIINCREFLEREAKKRKKKKKKACEMKR